MPRTRRNHTNDQNLPRVPGHEATIRYGQIARATFARACRYPFASLFGIGSTITAHLTIVTLVPEDAGLLGLAIVELFAGTVLFLVLATFMVLRHGPLNHLGSIFRSGAVVSLCATAVTTVPLIIAFKFLPPELPNLPQWQFLRESLQIGCVGFGVVAIATVLPAFVIAWPIHVEAGIPLSKSVLFVWRNIEGKSYSSMKMSLFVALVGWFLLSVPGAALLVPVLYAHFTAVLFDQLVIADTC